MNNQMSPNLGKEQEKPSDFEIHLEDDTYGEQPLGVVVVIPDAVGFEVDRHSLRGSTCIRIGSEVKR